MTLDNTVRAVYLNNCLFLAHIYESLKKNFLSLELISSTFCLYHTKTYPHHNLSRKYVPTQVFHHPSIHSTSPCLLYSYTHFFKQDEIYESQYAFINPLESGHIEFLESIFIKILILRKSTLKLKHLPGKILHFDEKSAKIQLYLDLA